MMAVRWSSLARSFVLLSIAAFPFPSRGHCQEDPLPSLLEALKSGETKDRRGAAFRLGGLGDLKAVPPLVDATGDDDPEVRWAACVALGKLKAQDARDVLILRARDPDGEVRWAAVWALGYMGGEEVAAALVDALGDGSREVAKQAKESLRLMTDRWWDEHETDPKAHHDLGVLLGEKGLYEEALKELDRAVELDPGYAKAHLGLGVTYGFMDDLDRAIASFNEALKLDPELYEARYYLAVALKRKGDIEGAIQGFLRAYELKKDKVELCYNLVLCYADRKDASSVARWLTTAIGLDASVLEYAKKDPALDGIREAAEVKKCLESSAPEPAKATTDKPQP